MNARIFLSILSIFVPQKKLRQKLFISLAKVEAVQYKVTAAYLKNSE